MHSANNPINKKSVNAVEALPGIFRRTLTYNNEAMLCHFEMKKGAQIPLHQHVHVQNGYCVTGKLRFFTKTGDFIVTAGDSYIFNSNEAHGADVLEESDVVEIFIPCREEYI
jgi:quercetin dioxygenase-like cupin family protein